ncbi:MAG: hypothetical protein IPH37_20200 [Burkholderiales bacterium]|nr:hypothetical protein [Burkholderiales bacterium]
MFPVKQSLQLVQMMVVTMCRWSNSSEMEQESWPKLATFCSIRLWGSVADMLKIEFAVHCPCRAGSIG